MKINDIGIGFFSNKNAKKIIAKDGGTNVVHLNKSRDIGETFNYLINVSWARFFMYIVLGYIVINIFFGLIYTCIGIEQLTTKSDSLFKDFLEGFFFSAQTVTTVGYGSISPEGLLAQIVSSIEALIGLLSFSFITGLLYGRFSKPHASISFSDEIILRPFKKGYAVMFRLKNNRSTMMIEPSIKVNMAINDKINPQKRNFYRLELERDNIMYLPTAWTVVHEIEEGSPFYQKTEEEIKEMNFELFILLDYFDSGFNQTIYKSFSYDQHNLVFNKKFKKALVYDDEGFVTLDHKTFDMLEDV